MSGTVEETLAVRYNARVVIMNSPEDIFDAVARKKVHVGLLDASKTSGYLQKINDMSLKISKIYDTNSGYGVVLSAGLEVLETDIRGYVLSNQVSIDGFVNIHVNKLEVIISRQLVLIINPTAY